MQPKPFNIFFWVFLFLFAALRIFFVYRTLFLNDDAKKLIHEQLGYPVYFIPFTGYAKLIGAIIILIPGLRTIKEWAYAGLFFDLVAAIYSGIALSGTVDPMMAFMLIWFVPGVLSYVFWHKKMGLEKLKSEVAPPLKSYA